MTYTIITKSNLETKKFAQEFADNLKGGEIIALSGDLGAGKTTFTQGLAKGLGIKDKITSPTFVLMKQYGARVESKGKEGKNLIQKQRLQSNSNLLLKPLTLVHIDAYRMQDERDTLGIGICDFLGRSNTVTIMEWPEKIIKLLPKNTIWIKFKHINENTREIVISNRVIKY